TTWAWMGPLASTGAIVAMLAGAPRQITGALLALGGVGLVVVFAFVYRTHPGKHVIVMGLGAEALIVAAIVWATGIAVPLIVPLLAAFLVITITGERLELARFGVGTGGTTWFIAAVGALGIGATVAAAGWALGPRVAGVGLIGLALWLGRFDVARRTIRLPDPTRYIAAALLAGYVWIAFAGIVWVGRGLEFGQPGYDASVHAVFLGFVMSMVFGHAMIVLPSLTGLSFPWNRMLWFPLGLLHLSLVIRVVGDLVIDFDVRRWGGVLNAIALVSFVLVALYTVAQAAAGRRAAAQR
ncbi:MAG: hypothetical protein M3094_04935, partial [Actinomycetia bacterium]|nr:hypothetical protein [Actinomycetes bacterium]